MMSTSTYYLSDIGSFIVICTFGNNIFESDTCTYGIIIGGRLEMSVKVINNISQMRADAAAHKKFKCPACRESFKSNDLLLRHAETVHKDEIPEGFTAKRWLVGRRYDRWEKICDICHLNKTEWQESAGRYKPICESTECRQKWRQQFMDRFKKKNGTDQDIANPEYLKNVTRRPENLIEIPGTVDCGELVRC